jgi:hypothetical protein
MRPQNAYLQDPTSLTQNSNSLFHNQNTYPDFCMVTLSLPTHAHQYLNMAMTASFHILSNYYSLITLYRLDGLGIESCCGARFSKTNQTSPGAHPAYHTMGTRSLSGEGSKAARA